MSEALI
jgi:hypothetical protein